MGAYPVQTDGLSVYGNFGVFACTDICLKIQQVFKLSVCQLIYCRSLLLAVRSFSTIKLKIAHVFQFVKFPVMENPENDAAGKEHRPESSPFLNNERGKTCRPCSRKKNFQKKDTRLKTQVTSHKSQVTRGKRKEERGMRNEERGKRKDEREKRKEE